MGKLSRCLRLSAGRRRMTTEVGITPAFAGIAETGTLLLRSGQDGPTTLNFLPDTHIVLLPAGRLSAATKTAGIYCGRRAKPCRTSITLLALRAAAMVNRPMQLGAHGPLRLHIVIVDS